VRFTLTTNPGVEETTSEALEPAEEFAERVYYDCQQTSIDAHPRHQVRRVFEHCPAWDSDTQGPATPTTCEQAVCAALISECVAENLYAISHEVQDFESSTYSDRESPNQLQFTAPPQLAAAKATLVEVASTWAARAIQISGENLRQGLGVPPRNGVGYQAACTAGTTGTNALFRGGNTLLDVLGNLEVNSSWAEVFLSTLAHVSDFQTTLAGGIEQTFSAVAEAEYSRNTSASVAARFAWVEGRTSRARAAHALIGGDREGGLSRVPKGYGSLGRLNSTERQALGEIRGVGIDPAVLSGTAVDIVDAVVAARRA